MQYLQPLVVLRKEETRVIIGFNTTLKNKTSSLALTSFIVNKLSEEMDRITCKVQYSVQHTTDKEGNLQP